MYNKSQKVFEPELYYLADLLETKCIPPEELLKNEESDLFYDCYALFHTFDRDFVGTSM